MSNHSPKPKSRTAIQRRKKVKLESKKHKLGKKKIRHAANHDSVHMQQIEEQLKALQNSLTALHNVVEIKSIEDLEKMMQEAIENEEYEIAAKLRDRISEIKQGNK